MVFIDQEIQKGDLQITKEGFFRLYEEYRRKGMSMQAAYNRVEGFCEKRGVKGYFSSFLSFKTAFYSAK